MSQGFNQGHIHSHTQNHSQEQKQTQNGEQYFRMMSLSKPASELYENAINLFDALGMNSELRPRVTIKETDQSEIGINYDNKTDDNEQEFAQNDYQLNKQYNKTDFVEFISTSTEQMQKMLEKHNIYAEEQHIKTLNNALNNHEDKTRASELYISKSLVEYLKINEQICNDYNETDLPENAKKIAQIRKALMTQFPVKGLYSSCHHEYKLVMIDVMYDSLLNNTHFSEAFHPKTKAIFEQAKKEIERPLLILYLENLKKLAIIEWCEYVNHKGPRKKMGVRSSSGVKKKLKCTVKDARIIFNIWEQIPGHFFEDLNNENKAPPCRVYDVFLNKNRVPEVTVNINEEDNNQYKVDIVNELKKMKKKLEERIDEDFNKKLLERYKNKAKYASQLKEVMYVFQYLQKKENDYLRKSLGLSVEEQNDILKTIESSLTDRMGESDFYISKKYQSDKLCSYEQGYDSGVELLKQMHNYEPGIINQTITKGLYVLKMLKKNSEYIEKFSTYQSEMNVYRNDQQEENVDTKYQELKKAGKLSDKEKNEKPKVANINKLQLSIS